MKFRSRKVHNSKNAYSARGRTKSFCYLNHFVIWYRLSSGKHISFPLRIVGIAVGYIIRSRDHVQTQ